jgi:uncharacterized repeat protein (TIGR03803 family)
MVRITRLGNLVFEPIANCRSTSRFAVLNLALLLAMAFAPISLHAQSFTPIHEFSGPDGAFPYAGLTADQAGNLYGTTTSGGNNNNCEDSGCGSVFELKHSGSGWVLSTLYTFQGGSDGAIPTARVLFGPDGVLYGTTLYGGNTNGNQYGWGTVFKLTAPAHVCESVSCPWTHTVLYRFTGGSDGGNPGPGDLTFDATGNIYGTTQDGGIVHGSCFNPTQGCGVVYKLTSSGSGWTESVLYSFTGGTDGHNPMGGVIFDQQGNLYGTAYAGGASNYGTIYQLTSSGSGWSETTLHSFSGYSDGQYPAAGLIADPSGNFYGTASSNASDTYKGTAFELARNNGSWTFTVLYLFPDPDGPMANLAFHNGDLYGTTSGGGSDFFGTVFELMPGSGDWTATTLYNFTGNDDGSNPYSSVLIDSSGNLYGTAMNTGTNDSGTVWEITP